MSTEDTIQGLPTLDHGIVRRRRGEVVDVALQLLDLRGGPTEPIRVRAIPVQLPDDPGGPIRSLSTDAPSFDVTVDVDPISGLPIIDTVHAWACTLDAEATATAAAVRRVARAHAGVNLRSSLERRGWSPGLVLTRSQLFPLDPAQLLWLDGEAWTIDEVCCVTPTCPCQDLSLDFEVLRDRAASGPPLSAGIDLGTWTITQTSGSGPARELAERWMAQPGARERARALFDRGHAAGREIFDPFVTRGGGVQPDARCPCGSHRKYKRCCERASPAPLPGDLHALQSRARRALMAFAAELGVSLALADAPGANIPTPSDESRLAWLLYWRRIDGLTLADRFLADSERGDLWLRRWIETASGTPPDVFEVLEVDRRVALLSPLADLEGDYHQVLPPSGGLRTDEVVFGAPVRLMGNTVIEGAWRAAGGKEVGLGLAVELESVRDELDRLLRPDRVLRAMLEVLTAEGCA